MRPAKRESTRKSSLLYPMVGVVAAVLLLGISGFFLLTTARTGYPIGGLMTPLIYQTGPKTSVKSGWSCSMREKRCIKGPSHSSRMVGMRS